ncbi:MAG: FAD:protein FMN transferase, partial [Bdellovibrionales bacterium]|nr:FAD:protein FMN transferase [Bdellovibrionales bacterium]
MSFNESFGDKSFKNGIWTFQFNCMGGPCEILIETSEEQKADLVASRLYGEAKRIELKFSRYDKNSFIYKLNNSGGRRVTVDEETGHLLDFAFQCFKLSDGMFDISSGVLRKIWTFDCKDHVPTDEEVESIVSKIGMDN